MKEGIVEVSQLKPQELSSAGVLLDLKLRRKKFLHFPSPRGQPRNAHKQRGLWLKDKNGLVDVVSPVGPPIITPLHPARLSTHIPFHATIFDLTREVVSIIKLIIFKDENHNMAKIGIGGASLENFLNFEIKKGGKGVNFMDSPINVDDDMKIGLGGEEKKNNEEEELDLDLKL
ncbi:hypothetical protein HAX54_051849 [Datura stramonium]|uniref:Uncharacterized protein n=1 Tax=Datura stramonium TaxID=4076 RepID=A0ABS8WQD6_DATST|nr:hypothetical protein [Datura stramonium]